MQDQNPHEIIGLDHASAHARMVTVVDCNLGTTCNYRCSYCPPFLHDGRAPWLDEDSLIEFITYLKEQLLSQSRQLYVQFTGGEPTLHPQFPSLAAFLANQGISIGLISNGSRSLDWWVSVAPYLSRLILTYHAEGANRTRFWCLLEALSSRLSVHVNVTMNPSRFDECSKVAKDILSDFPAVTVTMKPLLVQFGSSLYPYSEKQLGEMSIQNGDKRESVSLSPLARGVMEVTRDDGSCETMSASHLLVTGQNRWKGWQCEAGRELLVINHRGDIYRAVCRVGGKLGNISEPPWNLPASRVTCTFERCSCLMDIMTKREKPIM